MIVAESLLPHTQCIADDPFQPVAVKERQQGALSFALGEGWGTES